ncbi:MAG: hypothetical protein QNJ63_22450 [Calothrix sp. MO_192.B10]|nr:hypothetical protein [Calothrix sp. MO_192.B10]
MLEYGELSFTCSDRFLNLNHQAKGSRKIDSLLPSLCETPVKTNLGT